MTEADTNRYWKEVVDTIQDGVMLVDSEGTILSVNRAFESTLETGLDYERKALYLAFASEDAREGLTAFTEKRKPEFEGR